MITVQDRQAFADLSIIIKMMPKNMQEKINSDFINLIEQNKASNYISLVKPNIPLKEQQLSETTEALLALIYRDYLCSPNERNNLIFEENEELKKIEIENNKKYEINFDKRKYCQNEEIINTSLIEYKKETLFTKIINKIKQFFNFK